MLIIALVLALIGLAALVAAVVTSNELIAWVCIGASVIGVLLLIGDALRARRGGDAEDAASDDVASEDVASDGADEDLDGEASAGVGAEPEPEPVQDYPEDEATVTQPESGSEKDTEADTESDTEIAGVTDADDDAEAGGAVDISPDPDVPPKS